MLAKICVLAAVFGLDFVLDLLVATGHTRAIYVATSDGLSARVLDGVNGDNNGAEGEQDAKPLPGRKVSLAVRLVTNMDPLRSRIFGSARVIFDMVFITIGCLMLRPGRREAVMAYLALVPQSLAFVFSALYLCKHRQRRGKEAQRKWHVANVIMACQHMIVNTYTCGLLVFHLVILSIIRDREGLHKFSDVVGMMEGKRLFLAILSFSINLLLWLASSIILWYHTAVEFDMTIESEKEASADAIFTDIVTAPPTP